MKEKRIGRGESEGEEGERRREKERGGEKRRGRGVKERKEK